MENPVSQYMAEHGVGTVEMARLLGISKGYASLLKAGEKPVSVRVARRLGDLTGKPWSEYVPDEVGTA